MPLTRTAPDRGRRLLVALGAASVVMPALASSRRLAPVSEGPFYPPSAWRSGWADWDADLTRTARSSGGPVSVARGEHMGLDLQVVDGRGRTLDGAEVEIWQCDALGAYRHPRVSAEAGRFDPGFQGLGAARSNAEGRVSFRTIRPVVYPGRAPHIHIKVRHATVGELTSQLFVQGDVHNAGDGLWRRIPADIRPLHDMVLRPAPAGSGLAWVSSLQIQVA